MADTFYYTLPNGVQVVHRTTPSPVVYVGVMVGAGTRHELPQQNGIAHYIEHCVFKGTQHYSARQIINRIESIGGEINAYTTKEETTFYAATLQQHWRTTLHVIADMVLHPTFPKNETDKELTVIYDEIESYNDSPSELIYDDFESVLYQGHPFAMPILGTKKTLRHIAHSSDIPLTWMHRHYLPERTVLFVLGNVPTQQVLKYAQQELGDFPYRADILPLHNPMTPLNPPAPCAPQNVSYRRHTHQTHLIIGARAYPIAHPKQNAMFLLNNILGGGSMSSLLNLKLREQKGLVYNIESQYTPLSDTGYWNIYLACEPHNKELCLQLCLQQLKQLCDNTLSTSRFQRAVKQLQGQLAIAAENQENNALSMAKQMLYLHHTTTWQETFHKIQQLTPILLQETAKEVYNESKISILQYD